MKRQHWRDAEMNRWIAERLKMYRIARGLTQEDVCFELGVNIARIESGRHSLSISTLARLCRLYGITLAELLQGVETQHSHAEESGP